jgi:deazaflavin-dependent oxidoreductase (nitroreductase family)
VPSLRARPPRGLVRLALGAPIWIYRLGLGALLGDRFLMLTHRGRKSGLPRRTVVEVVRHDRDADTYVIASGWGEKANWLRNVLHDPHVEVYVGQRVCAALAERLGEDEAARVLRDYARRHPIAFRVIARLMSGQDLRGSDEDCLALARSVPLVALRMQGARSARGEK